MSHVPPRKRAWRKSSYSRPDGDDCVEVAATNGTYVTRDSTTPHGPVLTLTRHEFAALLGAIKTGTHDLP